MKPILFVTSNRHKFLEAESILNSFGVKIIHKLISYPEIRAAACEEVAAHSARVLFKALRRPLFVEDSGLFVRALNGFPGAFSGWFHRKLGCGGLLKLMRGVRDRRARFASAVAFADGKGVRLFEGACDGTIAGRERGRAGFGFDPVFIPRGSARTFAEDPALKHRVSHRARALEKFAK
ncbi:MAG: RdgB/HAM1 family non-canonical purine NTP pyrophosphatase, partial [Candidatus Micrarchaeia archaeon]